MSCVKRLPVDTCPCQHPGGGRGRGGAGKGEGRTLHTASVPRQHLHHPAPLGSYHLLIETSGGYLPRGHEMENKVGGRQEGGSLHSAVNILGGNTYEGLPPGDRTNCF